MPPIDTAAKAANDKTIGDHLGDNADALDRCVEFITTEGEAATIRQLCFHIWNNESPSADFVSVVNQMIFADDRFRIVGGGESAIVSLATEIETKTSDGTETDALRLRITQLEDELRGHRDLRAKEQDLLSQRNAALHAIEGAKARLTSEKKGLAEIEESIAALLAQGPGVQTTLFGDASPGQAETVKALAPAWADILPSVPPESVRVIDRNSGAELPTVDAICAALVTPQMMEGEKRSLTNTVECYGSPWIVTHLWKEENSGSLRANAVRLYSKDEWQQLHDPDYGRAVQDFDQTDESKALRQTGGVFCGLVVKVGRKTFVVGPQKDALHLAFTPDGGAPDDHAPEYQDEGDDAQEGEES